MKTLQLPAFGKEKKRTEIVQIKEVMKPIRVACEWDRKVSWKKLINKDMNTVNYSFGRLCVEYFINDDNRPQVRRVLKFDGNANKNKRKVEKIYVQVPDHLKQAVAKIVSDNERNYGHLVYSVILPDGENYYV